MATGWSTITKENTNFARLCKLLIDGGTHALRVIFDAKHPPHDLKKHLMDSRIHNILKNLKAKKLLRPEQWNRLYPSVGIATSTGFDITLLSLLLRNICNLPTPVKGWNEEPATGSVNAEDDVVRLRLYRNKLGHISEPALSDADFNKYWNDIETVLLRHGVNKTAIDSLKTQSFETEDKNYYIKCLKEWIADEADRVIHEVKESVTESEKRLLEKVDNVEQKVDQLSSERPSSQPAKSKDVQLYCEKLREAIITQTDDLQPKGMIHAPMKTDDIFTNVVVHHGKERCPEQMQSSGQHPVHRKTLTEIKHCSEIFVHKDENLTFLKTLRAKIRKLRKKNPKRIIVSGEPGIGKTLFSQKLVRDLAKNSISIPDAEYTYLIPFRLLNSLDKELSLQELLNLSPLLNEATMIDDALMEYFSQHSEKLLIVLDGFDEYKNRDNILKDDEGPNDSKAKMPVTALVSKLIQKKILSNAVITVTSRPGEADELNQKIHFDRYVEISGFSEQQVIEFVEKYFSTKPEEVKNMALSKVKESAHYISFGRVPFRCLLILRLVSLRCLHEFGQDKRLTRQELNTNRDYRYWSSDGLIGLLGVTDTDWDGIAMLVESTATSISSPPHTLSIGDSPITITGIKRLMSSLSTNCSITRLELWLCNLNDEHVKCLCKDLQKTKITELDLDGNKITDGGVYDIMVHLPSNLTELDLSRNNISAKCKKKSRQFCSDKYPGLELYI
ncbi:uncharacterized protein LOC110243892 [Exaiptasia diaphana]|uniref:NACHT domain-containing protein n=1 Tax=Exaiptasia diaphana TaxID=2652724 RepID=A0A913XKM5_EXADI|nr:uncharacterized protein LOC110243892 [Exaiptasia diaphana]